MTRVTRTIDAYRCDICGQFISEGYGVMAADGAVQLLPLDDDRATKHIGADCKDGLSVEIPRVIKEQAEAVGAQLEGAVVANKRG